MPYDGVGVANIQGQRPVNGQDTDAAQINVPLDDIQSMLSQVLLKSGVAPMTGPLNMNDFKITGVGAPANSADVVNKAYVDTTVTGIAASTSVVSGSVSVLEADYNKRFIFSAAGTISIPATASFRSNWAFSIIADGGDVAVTSVDAINGSTSFYVKRGQIAYITKVGSVLRATTYSDAFSGPQIQSLFDGLKLSQSSGDAVNDITIATGVTSSDVSPYYLMQLSSSLTKRIDAPWAVGSDQGGLDTGSVSDGTYYIWLIQRSGTGVVDALYSLSSTAPTLPANYDRKRLTGTVVRTSGANQPPNSSNSNRYDVSPSGTSILIPLPLGIRRLNLTVSNINVSPAARPVVRIGVSTPVATGYTTSYSTSFGSTVITGSDTTGAVFDNSSGTGPFSGEVTFTRVGGTASTRWAYIINASSAVGTPRVTFGSGWVIMSDDINVIQFTTLTNGTLSGSSASFITATWDF